MCGLAYQIISSHIKLEGSFQNLIDLSLEVEGGSPWKLRTVVPRLLHTPSREETHFLYSNHLCIEFLEQMIPHLKALI